MAYVSQEKKAALTPAIKAVLKRHNMKASIAVRDHMTLVVNIRSGDLDILGAYKQSFLDKHIDLTDQEEVTRINYRLAVTDIDVNCYWISESYAADPEVVKFLLDLKAAMEGPGFINEDDSMTDYFHRSHYIDINVGKYNKPYVCNQGTKQFEPLVLRQPETA